MDDLIKLKAQAYDLVAQIQQLQRQLDETNKQISTIIQAQAEAQSVKSKKK